MTQKTMSTRIAEAAIVAQGAEREVQSFQKQLNDIQSADSGTLDVQQTLSCLWTDVEAIEQAEPLILPRDPKTATSRQV